MNSIKLIIIFMMYGVFTFGQNNTSEKKYVKLIVNNIITSADALSVDSLMRQQPGIIMSRMDYRTAVYFCIYNSTSNMSLSLIKSLIFNLGYSSKCHVSGFIGNGEHPQSLTKVMCTSTLALEDKTN